VPAGAAFHWPTLAMSQAPAPQAEAPAQPADGQAPTAEATKTATATKPAAKSAYGYRDISDFFNVREAYSGLDKGEWEFEVESGYFTRSNHKHDDFSLTQALKYGVTDDFHVQLELAEPLGYSGEGVGELSLLLFQTFWHEQDILPAFGGSAEIRIPTGYESSGVDGTFTGILSKQLCSAFRVHFMGYVETANGAMGQDDSENRRHFQWGVGPGFDFQVTDSTTAVLNYLQKCSEEYGQHNNNVLELGVVQKLPDLGPCRQALKFATDIGLDGQDETPNFGVKLQWSVEW